MNQTQKLLRKMSHRLRGLAAQNRLDGAVRSALIATIDGLRTDVAALRRAPCSEAMRPSRQSTPADLQFGQFLIRDDESDEVPFGKKLGLQRIVVSAARPGVDRHHRVAIASEAGEAGS
jgi:hypothetical protein